MNITSHTIHRLAISVVTGLLLVSSLSTSSAFAAKNYYKWVDENGVTHYSERKPHDRDAERISVATGRSTPDETTADTSTSNNTESSNSETAEQAGANAVASNTAVDTRDPERCESAQQNLKVLQENARVRLKTDDGSFRFLDENEKAAKTKEAQDAINEAC